MHFTKMNGAGNDFVILDAVEQPLGLAPEDVRGLYAACATGTWASAQTA